jgi:hypothetical protein
VTQIVQPSISFTPPPPFVAAAFTVNGFLLPVVDRVVDAQGKPGFVASTTSERGFAQLLSPRSPEDAVERLAREILRNRQ